MTAAETYRHDGDGWVSFLDGTRIGGGGEPDPDPDPPEGFVERDETNTGTSGTLTPTSGNVTISTPGTYENLDYNGQVIVQTSGTVNFVNCRIRNGGFWTFWVKSGTVNVTDCEIEGSQGGTAAVLCDGGTVHLLRCNIWGAEDGVRIGANGCTLRDSFIHTLRGDANSHYDGANFDATIGWEVTGNTIKVEHSQTGCIWIDDPRYTPSSGLLQGNLFAGGGYSVYAGPGDQTAGRGLQVLDNWWSTEFYPAGGSFGPVAYWEDGPENVWSGNKWYDGPNAGQPVGV